MCIIAAIERGKQLPDYETIRTMWENNPDGAGIMWADGERVRGSKGLMTLESFTSALDHIPSGAAAVLHFRIATSGGIRPDMCHPWPITSDTKKLLATSWVSDWGIAHNGIISGLGCKDLSDTGEYIRDVTAPLLNLSGDLMCDDAKRILSATSSGSRLAIMNAAGDILLTGNGWETDKNGVHYSNSTWHAIRWATTSYSGIDWYGWDKKYDNDVCPLYDTGAYILDENGDPDDADYYAIGTDNAVYFLDIDDDGGDVWYKAYGCKAFTENGLPLTYGRALELLEEVNLWH